MTPAHIIVDQVLNSAPALFPPSVTVPRHSILTEPQKALIRAAATLKIRTALYKRYLDRLELGHKIRP